MYYPKSQIIPDQYTNGDKLIYASSKLFYIGYYHIVSDGRFFTGRNPNDGVPQLLIFPDEQFSRPEDIIESNNNFNNTGNFTFGESSTDYDLIRLKNNIQPPPTTLLEPIPSQPSVSYPSFIRYFVKRVNNTVYIEINKNTYNSILNKDPKWNWIVYIPFELPWTTGGTLRNEVLKTNRDIVLLTEQRLKLYGFSNYITDYTEFYI